MPGSYVRTGSIASAPRRWRDGFESLRAKPCIVTIVEHTDWWWWGGVGGFLCWGVVVDGFVAAMTACDYVNA